MGARRGYADADFYEIRQPIALNRDATVMALAEVATPRVVGVYRWIGANWAREAGLPGPCRAEPAFPATGEELAFNHDGNLLAMSDPRLAKRDAGISPTMMPGPVELGAVYLFQRNDDDEHLDTAQRRQVRATRVSGTEFGRSIALSASGRTLAVGAPGENSNATGIDGDRNNEDAQNAGAAYLY